jgi:hypothetical protein
MLRELVDARRPFRGVARSDAKRMRGKSYKSGKAGKRGVAEGKRRELAVGRCRSSDDGVQRAEGGEKQSLIRTWITLCEPPPRASGCNARETL